MAIAADLTEREAYELAWGFKDHATFARESLHIMNLEGSIVPLELMPGQVKLNEAIARQRRRKKPVRLVVLKTRRSMFTAGATAEMFHDVAFLPGRKGIVVADRYKPAGLEAFGYLLQYHRGYSAFGRHGVKIELPQLVKDSEQQLRYETDSQMEVYSADVGEIRGGGRHWAIIDELAFWRNPGKTLPGVLNMVPKLPNTAVIVLSTANGIGGEFYELCQQAQDPNNESGWEFLFFGWLEHPVYRMPFDSQEAAVKFHTSLNQEEKFLAQRHGATLEQLHWRRHTIATECLGSLDMFHQEYPTTPEEAFLASGRPVFDAKALMRMPVVPGYSGELSEIEDGPIKRIIFQPGERGALTVWRRPEKGRRYVCGADPSKGKDVDAAQRGRDPDYSVGFVADADTGEQVALLRARIRPVAFAEYLALLCKWYGWAFLTPESNDEGFIDAILRTGYPHDCIYQQQRNPTDRKSTPVEEFGFYNDGQSRDWLVGAAEDAIRTQSITIVSAVVIQECVRFVIKPNGKKEAQLGAHDDCVIAYALTEIGRRVLPARTGARRPDSAAVAKIRYYGRKNRHDDDDDD
jgi:hypothetical protein